MTMIEFLRVVEQNPFILYYYAFSLIISILLGRIFLMRMGHQRIWNYFFSLLIYLMSVIGLFSLVLFFYQAFTDELTISIWHIGIPFIAMIFAILLIKNRVNIPMLTGFNDGTAFFALLFLMILGFFLYDYKMGWIISGLPIYLFLLMVLGLTILMQILIRSLSGYNKK